MAAPSTVILCKKLAGPFLLRGNNLTHNSAVLFTRDGLSLQQSSYQQLTSQTMGKSCILQARRDWPLDLSGVCSPWSPGRATQRVILGYSPALPKKLHEIMDPRKAWKELVILSTEYSDAIGRDLCGW